METGPIAVEPGCRVLVELVESTGESEQRVFSIVSTEQADFRTGLLDETAPLARALAGHFAGQTIPYKVGGLKEIRILEVKRLEALPSRLAADKRRASVRKAEAQSEITSQMIFASARGSKWGDYEVNLDKLLEEQNQKDEKKDERKEK